MVYSNRAGKRKQAVQIIRLAKLLTKHVHCVSVYVWGGVVLTVAIGPYGLMTGCLGGVYAYTVFISGFHSRGGKRLVPKFKGDKQKSKGGNPDRESQLLRGGAKAPPGPPEINPAYMYFVFASLLIANIGKTCNL